jgi:hypothetical protein
MKADGWAALMMKYRPTRKRKQGQPWKRQLGSLLTMMIIIIAYGNIHHWLTELNTDSLCVWQN